MRNVEVQRWMVDSRESGDDMMLHCFKGRGKRKKLQGSGEEKETSRVGGREKVRSGGDTSDVSPTGVISRQVGYFSSLLKSRMDNPADFS